MKRILFALLLAAMVHSDVSADEVKNIMRKEVGGRVLLEFDVAGQEKETYVDISITIEGKTYHPGDLHLKGDYGKVMTGEGKLIIWDAMKDFPDGYPGNITVVITAGREPYRDSLTGMEFVFILGGCFEMGDVFGDGARDEKPVHEVCLDDYYMGKYEVTQKQWEKIMGDNPSHFRGCGSCPVERVSWDDVQDYINRLNKQTGREYRLPTEAEWEFAARSGGKKERWAGSSSESILNEYAWYSGNSDKQTHPVGRKKSNGLGLHDMTGNVVEWTSDLYDENYYGQSIRDNPAGPDSGQYWVLRGGAWSYESRDLRTMSRFRSQPGEKLSFTGFRLVLHVR